MTKQTEVVKIRLGSTEKSEDESWRLLRQTETAPDRGKTEGMG